MYTAKMLPSPPPSPIIGMDDQPCWMMDVTTPNSVTASSMEHGTMYL